MPDAEGTTASATAPPGGTATAVSTPATTETKVVEYGDATDLPEVQWLWRRVFVFASAIGILALAWRISERITEPAALHDGLRICLGLIALLIFTYLSGASAEAIVKLVGAIRTSRKETITSAPSAT